VFREVDRDSWSGFADLFEERGGPKSCWCMIWRASPAEAKNGASGRSQIEGRVDAGAPVGILGYMGDKPVAWCSIAPRNTYRKLGGLSDQSKDERVWSLVCFFIKRDYRHQGLSSQLIDAAVCHAERGGATVVERAGPVV
jgi:GNAT superfamily N-acetyltransferase